MSECEKCHGTHKVECPECHGEKEVTCEKCHGKGTFKNCVKCDSSGKVACGYCDGTGEETDECPVCVYGKVSKTRWINCRRCHGTGIVRYGSHNQFSSSCDRCDGRGQVKESYKEICPNCHGEYKRKTGKHCKHCGGSGKETCSRCGGTGHARCQTCEGTGKAKCGKCNGEGAVKCPDCAERERIAREKRREIEEEQRREDEAREAAEQRAKERNEKLLGCGCLLSIVSIVGFLIWWWIEGMTMAALPGMWRQATNSLGGAGGIVKVFVGLVVLFLVWKVIAAIKRKKDTDEISTSTKKRWKFVLLGLLLGFFGAHLAYAKRWTLFLLLWAGFVIGGSFGTSNETATPSANAASQVQQTEQPKSNNRTISNIGFAVWGLLWIGGTLFIKKDGKGNRM